MNAIADCGLRIADFRRLALVLLSILPISIFGEDPPTITISKGDKINLTVSPLGGGDGAAATKTLQNDLTLSGYFTLSGNASYTVRGSATGGNLQGQVVDHSGGTVLSKSYSGGSRESAHHFADDIIETLTGNKGFASSKIAFIGTRSGKKEVYVGDYDGTNVRQLTHDGVISVHPSISPDGRRIAYTGYQSGYADVYAIDLAIGARNRIVNFPGTNSGSAFSPDGSRIALSVSKDGNPELYTVNAGGGSARRLTHTHTRCRIGADLVAERRRNYLFVGRSRFAPTLSDLRLRRFRTNDFDGPQLLHGTELVAGWKESRIQCPRRRRVSSGDCRSCRRRYAHRFIRRKSGLGRGLASYHLRRRRRALHARHRHESQK